MQCLTDWITWGKGCCSPRIENSPVSPTLRSGRKGGFTDYAMQFIKMIYKPLQIHLIHFLLISEKGFFLFLLWLPTSPSKNTWVWGYLTVAREEKEETKEHFGHNSRTQIHVKPTVSQDKGIRDSLDLLPSLTRWGSQWCEDSLSP